MGRALRPAPPALQGPFLGVKRKGESRTPEEPTGKGGPAARAFRGALFKAKSHGQGAGGNYA
eukprot:15077169-Heterocapsa_arctica.AAC.1